MQDPRTPHPESVGRGGAPRSAYHATTLPRDRRGTVSSPFGFLAAAIASAFVGGVLMAGHYGNDAYRDVVGTLERTLGF